MKGSFKVPVQSWQFSKEQFDKGQFNKGQFSKG